MLRPEEGLRASWDGEAGDPISSGGGKLSDPLCQEVASVTRHNPGMRYSAARPVVQAMQVHVRDRAVWSAHAGKAVSTHIGKEVRWEVLCLHGMPWPIGRRRGSG